MPRYTVGCNGSLTPTCVLPESDAHLTSFLQKVDKDLWAKLISYSDDEALNNTPPDKIVIDKALKHEIHDRLLDLANEIGPELVTQAVTDCTPSLYDGSVYATLLTETYKHTRSDQLREWTRMPEYDSDISSIWNKDGGFLLTVVSPVTQYRKLKKMKFHLDRDYDLKTFDFSILNYSTPLIVTTHSYGYQIFLQNPPNVDITSFFAFNPATTSVIIVNPYHTKYFVNYNDEIQTNVFIQSSDVVGVSDISGGAPAHSLKQWF